MSPSSSSEYGLAYADSDAEDEDKGLLPFPGTIKKSPTSSPRKGSILRSSPRRDASPNHIRFPSMTTDSSGSLPQTAALKPGAQKRRERMSTNSNSVYSDSDDDDSVDERALRDSPKSSKGLSLLDRVANSHATARGADLEVVMETLIEDLSGGKDYEDPEMRPLDKGRTFPTRSNTVPAPGSGLSAHDYDLNAKVLVKSAKPKKIRVCRKCDKQIDDGRWIAIDGGGGGVLCETCWKNMYLPKRLITRCARSVDDVIYRLKLLRYRPRMVNSRASITSSASVAQHARNHFRIRPSMCSMANHFVHIIITKRMTRFALQLYADNPSKGLARRPVPSRTLHMRAPRYPCKTRLEEYWEVDGRMLCDKHVHAARSTYDGDSDYGDDVGAQDLVMSGRAMKRVTRFIDLGEGGLR
ncbi:Paxillin [Salix suchowensis]|nr:Paxillin [Salix suchowensis]